MHREWKKSGRRSGQEEKEEEKKKQEGKGEGRLPGSILLNLNVTPVIMFLLLVSLFSDITTDRKQQRLQLQESKLPTKPGGGVTLVRRIKALGKAQQNRYAQCFTSGLDLQVPFTLFYFVYLFFSHFLLSSVSCFYLFVLCLTSFSRVFSSIKIGIK